jgi:hypothetical protein
MMGSEKGISFQTLKEEESSEWSLETTVFGSIKECFVCRDWKLYIES